MLNAWIDDRLMAAIDQFLKGQPQMNRSKVLVQSVVNFLADHGIDVPVEVLGDFRPRKRLRPDALVGVSHSAMNLKPSIPREKSVVANCDDQLKEEIVSVLRSSKGKRSGAHEINRMMQMLELTQRFVSLADEWATNAEKPDAGLKSKPKGSRIKITAKTHPPKQGAIIESQAKAYASKMI